MPVSEALLSAAASDEERAYAMITQWSFSDAHQLGGNQQPGMPPRASMPIPRGGQ